MEAAHMTTVASDQDRMQRLDELDAQAAQEWAAYTERLRDLIGAEYEAEESAAWEDLQVQLSTLRDARDLLTAAPDPESGLT
jgi:hypothetical protein